MSYRQFTYSYISESERMREDIMNQMYTIHLNTKSFIFLFLSLKSVYKTATFATNKMRIIVS